MPDSVQSYFLNQGYCRWWYKLLWYNQVGFAVLGYSWLVTKLLSLLQELLAFLRVFVRSVLCLISTTDTCSYTTSKMPNSVQTYFLTLVHYQQGYRLLWSNPQTPPTDPCGPVRVGLLGASGPEVNEVSVVLWCTAVCCAVWLGNSWSVCQKPLSFI